VARFVLVSIAFCCIVASASAQTTQPWENPYISEQRQTAMVWQAMRNCAQQAAQRVQDHTPEGNRQREAMRLNCLRAHHLPVDPQPSGYVAPR
jgi:hypothetical protein